MPVHALSWDAEHQRNPVPCSSSAAFHRNQVGDLQETAQQPDNLLMPILAPMAKCKEKV